jgi:hypothetical protein
MEHNADVISQGEMIAGFITYCVAVGCYARSFQDEEETDKA